MRSAISIASPNSVIAGCLADGRDAPSAAIIRYLAGLRVVAGLTVVMREDRGGFPDVITRLPLDERGDHSMTFPAVARQRPVGHLAYEHVFEDELPIAGHARARLAVG